MHQINPKKKAELQNISSAMLNSFWMTYTENTKYFPDIVEGEVCKMFIAKTSIFSIILSYIDSFPKEVQDEEFCDFIDQLEDIREQLDGGNLPE